MSVQGAPAQAAPNTGGEQQQGSGWMTTAFRWLIMYYLINFAMKKWNGNANPKPQIDQEGNPIPTSISQRPHSPLWKSNIPYNLRIYLSAKQDIFSVINEPDSDSDLVYDKSHLEYSCNDNAFDEKNMNISVPVSVAQNNGSYYAHIVMSQLGYPTEESHENYDNTRVLFRTHPLVSYGKKAKKKGQNLLYSDDNNTLAEEDSEDANEIISFWKPELTLRPLCDWTVYKTGSIPPQIFEHFTIEIESNRYWPVLYMDDFWLLKDRLIALNDTVEKVPFKISLSPISQWKFMLQSQMEQQYAQQNQWGMSSSEDNDEMRRLLMDSNPILLGVTMAVTLLHTVFDFLAFKNDIQFWHKTESVKGLSVRTIFINCFCQFIIFLYLMDQDTTWMILISSGIGLCIELWKITQAAKVTYGFDKYPWIKIEDKDTYAQSDTKKFDKQAMKYLAYVFYPTLLLYTIYSLVYNEHKGWYSFVIGTLVSFIYMFGFIMMCPQLYLNYKLKSTAFMPWRMMTYKFLNTIIDDLFAFLIKMPTMHRLSCFRDDIVFLIFIYQKYIYTTDYTRTNEYGFKKKSENNEIDESVVESNESEHEIDDEKTKKNK